MKIVKIKGKEYKKDEVAQNALIVKKWFVIQQIMKNDISEKYHIIEKPENIDTEYISVLKTCEEKKRLFYIEYINENWKETFPIMKDVSSFEKIRPKDGVEFCILIN